jgi:hypothetical protein
LKSGDDGTCWRCRGPRASTTKHQRQARTVAKHLSEEAWFRASAGKGSKGERLYGWACVPLPDPEGAEMGRWLLMRRGIEDPTEYAYYLAYGPAETPVHELIRIAGRRWSIDDGFEAAKEEVGLDEYEVYASGMAGRGTQRFACWRTLTSRWCAR